ncbi:transporter substrate-binding domain-containing protein [Idiomarina sp. UBA4520]|jgi:ABC-type amino acid transport substrate-binding protein|uniref:transporter substrate-binding domain-containing protein n=1 Tax=Idiomarina sp. UBA4520 TaxID=1946647 RepID=UPI000ACAE6C1|nr:MULTISPECIES: transporter substrate-binding domain-containing protein [unclassified Idiomarina]MBF39126.1 ABC transporter substrate-binding protein [Idiomarinaceae bacterium]
MSFRFGLTLLLITLSSTFTLNANAQSKEPLKVAVRVNAPFVLEKAGGYEGLAMTLWEDVAVDLEQPYELYPLPLNRLLTGVEKGEYDIGIGALTITSQRESVIDFSQPFHNAGLAVAVPSNNTSTWWAVTKRFVSFEFLKVILVLGGVLFIAGALVWFFERKENSEEFSEKPTHGLGSGFWWAAVTMTTVGYGDKSPRSLGGRAVSLIWMFTCVIIISSFTASIASSLTVSQFQSKVTSANDLPNARVATLGNSATAAWLKQQNIGYESFTDLNAALEKLNAGQLDAVVYDEPILRYSMRTNALNNIRLLPERVLRQDYGFVLPQGSELREPLNRALLKTIQSAQWRGELQRYLGQ